MTALVGSYPLSSRLSHWLRSTAGEGTSPGSRFLAILVRAAMIFVPLALLASAAFVAILLTQRAADDQLLQRNLEQAGEVGVAGVNAHLSPGVSDVEVLAEEQALQLWLREGSEEARRRVERQYASFLKNKPGYDSVRFIDGTGREVVRVDARVSGSAETVEPSRLQDKSTRYYFRDTMKLDRGSSYVSPMDLNVENGQIEQPLRPTLRFGSPVFDAAGKKRGIIILNYHAKELLDDLSRKAYRRGMPIWLIDPAGYWLLGPDPTLEWAFMYPGRDNVSFAAYHPDAWAAMKARRSVAGTISTPEGRIAYAAVEEPRDSDHASASVRPGWYVAAFVSRERLAMGTERQSTLAVLWCAALAVLAASSLAIGYHWHRRVEADGTVLLLAEKLERDNLSLAALNRELEAFAYSVSHDLRTPLRSIDGFSTALVEDYSGALDAAGLRYLARIRLAAQRMGQLIDDLLGLSQLSRSALRTETVDMTALASTTMKEIQLANPDRSIACSIEEFMTAQGDARLLQIVFENLIGNAVKFTQHASQPHVWIGCRREESGPAFFVRDNGAGFDMAHANRLFGAFQRLHAAEDYPGTGIGLATVQRIVNRHGGRIWAEASPGKGATFIFTLGKPKL